MFRPRNRKSPAPSSGCCAPLSELPHSVFDDRALIDPDSVTFNLPLNGSGLPANPLCQPVPQTTACAGRECGSASDGCGGTYACGTCPSGQGCGSLTLVCRTPGCDAFGGVTACNDLGCRCEPPLEDSEPLTRAPRAPEHERSWSACRCGGRAGARAPPPGPKHPKSNRPGHP